jgi:hypothetical protein
MNYIYDKNDGHCLHCGKKLAFAGYGTLRAGVLGK